MNVNLQICIVKMELRKLQCNIHLFRNPTHQRLFGVFANVGGIYRRIIYTLSIKVTYVVVVLKIIQEYQLGSTTTG